MQQALSQSNAEQYAAALKTYQAVYERWPTPWILINLGRVQQKMKNPEQAIVTYQRYLDVAPDDKGERIRVARAFLVQARQEIEVRRYKQMLARPIYKKWWFWTLIGSGVATAAITAGAIGGTRNALPPERRLAPNNLAFQF